MAAGAAIVAGSLGGAYVELGLTNKSIVLLPFFFGSCRHTISLYLTWAIFRVAGGVFAMPKNTITNVLADYYLGCDVAKLKLDVSLINAQGIEQWADTLPNEPVAIAQYLLTLNGQYPDKIVRCVVEATGVFHLPLAETSYAVSMGCQVYNPIITKAGSVRGEGRLYTPEPYLATKHYARSCQKLSILSSSFHHYKSHLTELLDGELRRY
jgi:hypothetical protein